MKIKKKEICNKYKLLIEKNNIIYNNKIEKLDCKYIKLSQKFDYNKNIDNIDGMKRLYEIIYNTYNLYKNNYFNCININYN